MISVLTLTYKRPHLLEEAIKSFLSNNYFHPKEMVIINDNPDVEYVYDDDDDDVRIINCKERFSSISAKIEWGYKQCKYDYIYRLDDDDLLNKSAINNATLDILENPGYDIYRSSGMYFFVNNVFEKIDSNINNGNIYAKSYLDRITFPDLSGTEDADITFNHKAKIYESSRKPTMLYRWGMNTLHISGMGIQPNEIILAQADKVLDDRKGVIQLHPHFDHDYYSQLP